MENLGKAFSKNEIKYELSNLNFFSLLSDKQREKFSSCVKFKKLNKGEKLQRLGEEYGGQTHLLTSGVVSVHKYSSNGESMSSLSLGVNDFCSFEYVIGEGISEYDITALTPVSMTYVPVNFFNSLVKNNTVILEFIVAGTRMVLKDMFDHRSILALSRPRERVITSLLYNNKKFGVKRKDGSSVLPKWLTQTKLAMMSGTTRETVGITFKFLQTKGLIVVNGRNLIIRNSFDEKYEAFM
ncbi:Crp/Fnr family transcriptional regulator [Liquorilactobacillus oeni]|uniref:HTH crp-type domain-containing protein n=1 Tax=Liquorilactobacillus oeni DSM 19972 TaxID=1423777 RepID=A0A0R1MLA8_9LACO|nr:Crp/Fnr family transcriptional regulator [Liquorilactobacillus oeni]KRL04776.1 hypothetical protein FD46_GL001913 [Liquorilactobacillus oeni DSM 19972]